VVLPSDRVTQRIFIQANNNQLIAAKVAKYALETRGRAREHGASVALLNVEEMQPFRAFDGSTYLRGGKRNRFDLRTMQSFTLSRFMPPELMRFSGRALVIDPDVFALADIGELLDSDLQDNAIAACRCDLGWETSLMLLDCAKLTHWRIGEILAALKDQSVDYYDLIFLRSEKDVLELPDEWNSLDVIRPETKMLHTTVKGTQPWKTGLLLGGKPRPLFGVIPRPPLRRLFIKPARFQPHPEPDVERAFMDLLKEALAAGAVTNAEIDDAIKQEFVRPDIRARIA